MSTAHSFEIRNPVASRSRQPGYQSQAQPPALTGASCATRAVSRTAQNHGCVPKNQLSVSPGSPRSERLDESGEIPRLPEGSGSCARVAVSPFIVHGRRVGPVNSVRVRHTNTGNASGWFLDQLEVQRVGAGRTDLFHCGRWLATDEDDCAIDLTLTEFGDPAPTPGVPIHCAEPAEPPRPATLPGTARLSVYDCSTDHRVIQVWTRDVTAGGAWKNHGALDHQYHASGQCPSGDPMVINLEPDHVSLVSAVDTALTGCPGNQPNHPLCRRGSMWIQGGDDVANANWVVP